MFEFKHVVWINGTSPCFLRDLDSGCLAELIGKADSSVALVVIDDAPELSPDRAELLSACFDSLLDRGQRCSLPAVLRPIPWVACKGTASGCRPPTCFCLTPRSMPLAVPRKGRRARAAPCPTACRQPRLACGQRIVASVPCRDRPRAQAYPSTARWRLHRARFGKGFGVGSRRGVRGWVRGHRAHSA